MQTDLDLILAQTQMFCKIPPNVRARVKIEELRLELNDFNTRLQKSGSLPISEWEKFNKRMRLGLRIAQRFGFEEETVFQVMYATSQQYISDTECNLV